MSLAGIHYNIKNEIIVSTSIIESNVDIIIANII